MPVQPRLRRDHAARAATSEHDPGGHGPSVQGVAHRYGGHRTSAGRLRPLPRRAGRAVLARRPRSTRKGDIVDGDEVAAEYEDLRERIADLQERLYAEEQRSLLIVLQGIDAAGKDGTVKHVLRGTNPAGVRVYSFKEPSTRSSRTTSSGATTTPLRPTG